MVRAKFRVNEMKDSGEQVEITMTPVYSTDPNHENKRFWDATPSGTLRMWIKNRAAAESFEVNGEYYVDFTKAG